MRDGTPTSFTQLTLPTGPCSIPLQHPLPRCSHHATCVAHRSRRPVMACCHFLTERITSAPLHNTHAMPTDRGGPGARAVGPGHPQVPGCPVCLLLGGHLTPFHVRHWSFVCRRNTCCQFVHFCHPPTGLLSATARHLSLAHAMQCRPSSAVCFHLDSRVRSCRHGLKPHST